MEGFLFVFSLAEIFHVRLSSQGSNLEVKYLLFQNTVFLQKFVCSI